MRKKDDWRKRTPDAAFDRNGFLINQGELRRLPFGKYDSERKGCGWIAAFNLLKLNGHEPELRETAEDLGRGVLLGGLAGISLFRLKRYLHQKGLPVRSAFGTTKKVRRLMRRSSNGILLYSLPVGLHFAAYRKLDRSNFQFYNSVYGAEDDILTDDAFFRERIFLPFCGILYLPDPDVRRRPSS